VCEVDNFRALQAVYDGFQVLTFAEAVKQGDIFVTVTGNKHVITLESIKLMKNGAILANSGHFDVEIDVEGMRKASKEVIRIRPSMDKYIFENGRHVYLLGEGRLVNLAAAEGHPSEVMATSFCGQALAVEWIVKNRTTLRRENNVITLPSEIDDEIAGYQLKALGISVDKLSEEQKKYMTSWNEGT